ncbi:hypothetical protein LTR08_006113 [Meristemomyces frigidus]|nr:hypothetical protein LTR08_006113 [Meristemomyces frigidus]
MSPYPKPLPVDAPIIKCGRHDFDTPLKFQVPHALDLIFCATIPILEKYNAQSLHYEADPLHIEALSISPTMAYACDTSSVVHCLVRSDFFARVQLKLVCDLDAGWSAGTVMIRDGERWLPLKQWLRTLPSPTMKAYRKVVLEVQYKWWRSTGKPFRFLDLPSELQRHILLFAIGEYVEPDYTSSSPLNKRVDLTKGTQQLHSRKIAGLHNSTTLPAIAPVNLALLGLNKSLRNMALDVLWGDTTKVYRPQLLTSTGYETALEHSIYTVPHTCLKFIRRIQLALQNLDYVDMFGVHLPGIIQYTTDIVNGELGAKIFKALPNIKYLDLHFQSTADSSYSPWLAAQHAHNRLSANAADMDLERLPCQEVLLDRILCFAAEYIIHIPRVELTGFIKTCTKRKWEAILNDDAHTEWSRVFEEQKQEIRALPYIES